MQRFRRAEGCVLSATETVEDRVTDCFGWMCTTYPSELHWRREVALMSVLVLEEEAEGRWLRRAEGWNAGKGRTGSTGKDRVGECKDG